LLLLLLLSLSLLFSPPPPLRFHLFGELRLVVKLL